MVSAHHMDTIPAAILKEITALRSANGLEPTEAATLSDLAKSKAKWATTETPRYRKAGRSPIFVSGKYLTSAGFCPATGEADNQGEGKPSTKSATRLSRRAVPDGKNVDEITFYKILYRKGFEVKLSQNLLSNEVEIDVPPSISKLGLRFGEIPANASEVYVTQTSPQVQISMSLDKFLELALLKP